MQVAERDTESGSLLRSKEFNRDTEVRAALQTEAAATHMGYVDQLPALEKEAAHSDSYNVLQVLGTEVGVADAMRFMGAIPEVANCR